MSAAYPALKVPSIKRALSHVLQYPALRKRSSQLFLTILYMQRPPIIITYSDHKKLTGLIAELQRQKTRQRETLQDLQAELLRAELKESSDIPPDIITMGSVARVRDLESDELMELVLVYPEEADADNGKISVLAPLGTAMLGYAAGDVFQWRIPAGVRSFKVEAVLFQPENAPSPEAAA
jgi:regulator of nucleoside diphosphate kinase